jgi:hypothetical protein
MFVLGLRAAGEGQHPRVRDGVRLIADRLLPAGGANYGNTIVLGQPLLPHIQPTGLAMLALGGERIRDPRVQNSLDYLARSIGPHTSAPSLAMALLGLTAHGRPPSECNEWVRLAFDNQGARPLAAFEKSLLLLVAAPTESLVALGLAPVELP